MDPDASIFVDLGEWLLQVVCPTSDIARSIGELYGSRARRSSPSNHTGVLLTCRVLYDFAAFDQLAATYSFNDSQVNISANVEVHYELGREVIRFRIDRTAIVEIDRRSPEKAVVYLDPVSYGPEHCLNDGVFAEPEAFFYPLCCEWLRFFGACLVHCGAVEIDGRAIVLSGPAGSGKSTHVLRLLNSGAKFLADDLMIVSRNAEGLRLMPYREVANARKGSVEKFPELGYLSACTLRGDGKYCVDLQHHPAGISAGAKPDVMLHIVPDPKPFLRPSNPAAVWDGFAHMAWFVSGPSETRTHFALLTDLLSESRHVDVSWGYLAENLDQLVEDLGALE